MSGNALSAFWDRVKSGEPITWLELFQAYQAVRKDQFRMVKGGDWAGHRACKSARRMVESGLASLEGDELGPPLNQLLQTIPDGYALPLVEGLVGMGCDVNAAGRGGWRPLHLCRSGSVALYLLRQGADPEGTAPAGSSRPDGSVEERRERPIEVALRFGAAGVFEALVGAHARLLRGGVDRHCTWTWGEVGECGGLPQGRGQPSLFLKELGAQSNGARAFDLVDVEGQTALDSVGWPAFSPTLDSLIVDHKVEPEQGRMVLFKKALGAGEGRTLKSYVAGYGVGDEEVLLFIRQKSSASSPELRPVLEAMFKDPSAAGLKASTRNAAMQWAMDNKGEFNSNCGDLLGLIGADLSQLVGKTLEDDMLLLPWTPHIRPPMAHYYKILRTAFTLEMFHGRDYFTGATQRNSRYDGCTGRLLAVHGFLDGAYEDKLARYLSRKEITSDVRKSHQFVDLWLKVGRGNPANLVKVLVGSLPSHQGLDWPAVAMAAWEAGWEADVATWPADARFLTPRSYPTNPHPTTVLTKASIQSDPEVQLTEKDRKPSVVRQPPTGMLGFPTDLTSVEGDLPPPAPPRFPFSRSPQGPTPKPYPPQTVSSQPPADSAPKGVDDDKGKSYLWRCLGLFHDSE